MRKKWGSGLLARKSHSAYKTRPAEKTLFLAKFAKNSVTAREPVHIYGGGVFAKTTWIGGGRPKTMSNLKIFEEEPLRGLNPRFKTRSRSL